jgi:hypothetical protein
MWPRYSSIRSRRAASFSPETVAPDISEESDRSLPRRASRNRDISFFLQVRLLLPLGDLEERRLRDVEVTLFDERRHVPEEEGQQKGPDVRPVDVGVRVVAAETAHSRDEVLVPLDGKVVDLSVGRLDSGNGDDRKSHQVAPDRLE